MDAGEERKIPLPLKRLMVNTMVIILIEEKRQQMIELALTHGFTAKETIQCSQELDELINRYLRETAPIDDSSSPVPQ